MPARARASTPAPLQRLPAHERCTEQLTAAALEGGVAQSVGSAAVIVSAPGGDSRVDMGLPGGQSVETAQVESAAPSALGERRGLGITRPVHGPKP